MGQLIFTLLGYLGASIAGMMLYLQRQRATALVRACEQHKTALEGAKELAQQRSQLLRSSKEELQAVEKKFQALNKNYTASLKNRESQEQQAAEKLANAEAMHARALRELEHSRSQNEALTKQLIELDQEKKQLRLEAARQLREEQACNRKDLEALQAQVHELRQQRRADAQKLKAQDRQIAQLGEKLSVADPLVLKKAKSRVSEYQHLYQLMRGQKELAEERNSNWELALRRLAAWTLEQQRQPQIGDNIGALVAQALEATRQGPLVADEYSQARSSLGTATLADTAATESRDDKGSVYEH